MLAARPLPQTSWLAICRHSSPERGSRPSKWIRRARRTSTTLPESAAWRTPTPCPCEACSSRRIRPCSRPRKCASAELSYDASCDGRRVLLRPLLSWLQKSCDKKGEVGRVLLTG